MPPPKKHRDVYFTCISSCKKKKKATHTYAKLSIISKLNEDISSFFKEIPNEDFYKLALENMTYFLINPKEFSYK